MSGPDMVWNLSMFGFVKRNLSQTLIFSFITAITLLVLPKWVLFFIAHSGHLVYQEKRLTVTFEIGLSVIVVTTRDGDLGSFA